VAARAGALTTTNIDVAKSVLERGKRNYALAGVASGEHRFLARDVLESLPRFQKRGETFDLIALDPPSYASTKGGRFSVERDYAKLAAAALALLSPGGAMLACVNHARMTERDLESALSAAIGSVGLRTLRVSFVAPPPDHPALPGRPPHLKSAWIST
jgi:23S rRNA (cytosine1962-C5)-methyltransferase